jgi:hypothetical protein
VDVFEGLLGALRRDRLGHGLLFVPPLTNEEAIPATVARFTRGLLCLEGTACGRCESCLLLGKADLAERPHPDLVVLKPDSETTGYAVEQIRDLSSRYTVGLGLSPRRVALFLEAEKLGTAANALLKLLEEPRPNSFLLLISRRPEGLLPTIRSRVQAFRLPNEPGAVAAPLEANWKPLAQWLKAGARPGENISTPADEDSFWKERADATRELREAYAGLWTASVREGGEGLDLEAQRRRLDFFARLEELIRSVEAFGNAPLQWSSFRSDVRLR